MRKLQLLLAIFIMFSPARATVKSVYCIKADGTVPVGCVVSYVTLTAAWTAFKADMWSDHGSYVMNAPVTFLYKDSTEYAVAYFGSGVTSSATNTITVKPDTGFTPIIDGFETYVGYVTFSGMKVNGGGGIGFDTAASHGVVTNCEIYNTTNYAISSSGANFQAHDNYIHDIANASGGNGIYLGSGATGSVVQYNEVVTGSFPISGLTDTVIAHNIVCCETRTAGQSDGFQAGVISDNVAWSLFHCMQPVNGTNATSLICVNTEWGQHYESGTGGVVQHGLVTGCANLVGTNHCDDYYAGYASANTLYVYSSVGIMPYASQAAPQVVLAYSAPGRLAGSDFNNFYTPPHTSPSTNALIAQIQNPSKYDSTIAAWQSDSGFDAHSVSVDPRFMSITDPVSMSRFTCTGCTTVAHKLATLKRAYTPTNIALKGRGCAWNGSTCVLDRSDIGAVQMTVWDTFGGFGSGETTF